MAAFLDKNALSVFWGKLKSYLQDNFLGKNSKAVSAVTADKIGIETKGSATQPVYINAGTPTACGNSLDVSITGSAAKVGIATVGSSAQPVYMNDGTPTACGFKIESVAALPSSPDANTLYIVTGS